MSTPLLPDDLDRELNNITSLHYRYAIARALHRGQEWQPNRPWRPSLSLELVLYIFRLCDLPRRRPSPALHLPWLQGPTEGEDETCVTVSAWGSDIEDRLWCAAPPLSKRYLEQIHKIRLYTLSCDQGWCDQPKNGSFSWFEIGILQRTAASEADAPGSDEAERIEVEVGNDAWGLSYQNSDLEAEPNPSTGTPLRWLSHNNQIAGDDFQWHIGNDIGPEHEIWNHLRPGDRLGVWINAQFGRWSCNGKQAEIEVWKR
ncbi:hypothetical protein FRB95_005709 [Tulasnella sp. JGI-2019a]|nr:hypothetical protein FRB95_005709 [Tulasnella sp. JGI-2019a]